MLVERTTPYTPLRRGIVVALDLDKYDYRPGTRSLIRPTEETILERLPPRVRIRKGAAIGDGAEALELVEIEGRSHRGLHHSI